MQKALLWVAVLLLIPGVLFAYTKPGDPTGFVNDFARLLTSEQKQQLETKLSDYEKLSGNEIAIATIQTLDGDTVENYAVKLFEDWKIGKKGQDNGILLLIAKDEHKIRIEVGYGLEPELTDIEAAHLIDNLLTPAFRNNDYFGGIDRATSEIIQKLGGVTSDVFTEQRSSMSDLFNYIIFAVLGLAFLSRIFAQTRSWWLGGAIGAAAGLIITILYGSISIGLVAFTVLIPLGLIIDLIFSRIGPGGGAGGLPGLGGWGRSSGGGGSFGGFGGGSSGGGGASGGW